ncbi:MAG: IS4 family transposase [Candidatus Chloroheliales bacterium]|nr:MAG: IS4 family transposase [Chloroflexota bacterium]
MDNITQLDASLQHLFGDFADQLARDTNFIKRQAKFSGASFAKTLVFGWLRNPAASLTSLCEEAFSFGTDVHNQTLDQRFSAEAATFMRQMLEAAVARLLTAEPADWALLAQFNGVYLLDATTISLPAELVAQWPGAANQYINMTAGLKLEVLLELCSGELRLRFYPARQHESNTEFNTTDLPLGSLRLADLGYFSLKLFAQFNREGRYWLSRWKVGTLMYRASGQRLHPAERFAAPEHQLDLPQLAATLRKEPLPTHLGHRQMTIYHHEPMAVVLFVFEQDGQLTDHQASGVVTIYLIEGAVKVTTAVHTYDLSPASMVALAPA